MIDQKGCMYPGKKAEEYLPARMCVCVCEIVQQQGRRRITKQNDNFNVFRPSLTSIPLYPYSFLTKTAHGYDENYSFLLFCWRFIFFLVLPSFLTFHPCPLLYHTLSVSSNRRECRQLIKKVDARTSRHVFLPFWQSNWCVGIKSHGVIE